MLSFSEIHEIISCIRLRFESIYSKSMKPTRSIATPLGWESIAGYPQHFVAGTHLYSWVEGGLTRPQSSLLSPIKISAAEGSARGDGKGVSLPRFLPFQHPSRLATPNKGDNRDDWGRVRREAP